MNAKIKEILEDLYTIEPTFQEKEEQIIKIIEKLLASRPEGEMDKGFKDALRERLIKELAEKEKKRKRTLGILRWSLGAAALVVTGLVLRISVFPMAPGTKNEAMPPSSPQAVYSGERSMDMSIMVEENESARGQDLRNLSRKQMKTPIGQSLQEDQSIREAPREMDTEEYAYQGENPFLEVLTNPLSTFSIDVDTASYANVRRIINSGVLPVSGAVRIEELVNYFPYDYPVPSGEEPFAFKTEISRAPWNREHRLLHIGIQGRKVDLSQMPSHNLVFLLDVSGSMNSPSKLPLLKKAFALLVNELRPRDRVAIVVYAGSAGLILDSTPGDRGREILEALDNLNAGGSTAGGEGIELAYKTAEKNFIPRGNNRVILATDGDFNVGPSSESALVKLIEKERQKGIFLSVLGFGSGNYKDSTMESLADKGNGSYAYIDSLLEARKVLVSELGGTLLTIASDVKIQVEFNPARVQSYRLIGYENRVMAARDFDDDTKDAGELGAGHRVTALYEIVPAENPEPAINLKYQENKVSETALNSLEIMTLKFRYKKPGEQESRLIEVPVIDQDVPLSATSTDFRFSAAVVEWGLLLRGSEYKGSASFDQVEELAREALGEDQMGYRQEFIGLVKKSALMAE